MKIEELEDVINGVIATIPDPVSGVAPSPEALRFAAENNGEDLIVIESKIADTAAQAMEAIGSGVVSEVGLSKFIPVALKCIDVVKPADGRRVCVLTRRLLEKWLRIATGALRFASQWKEECRALGHDLRGWERLERSVKAHRATHQRLGTVAGRMKMARQT